MLVFISINVNVRFTDYKRSYISTSSSDYLPGVIELSYRKADFFSRVVAWMEFIYHLIYVFVSRGIILSNVHIYPNLYEFFQIPDWYSPQHLDQIVCFTNEKVHSKGGNSPFLLSFPMNRIFDFRVVKCRLHALDQHLDERLCTPRYCKDYI